MRTEIRTGLDIYLSSSISHLKPAALRCGVCVAVAFSVGETLDEAAAREAFESAIRDLKEIERLGQEGDIRKLMGGCEKRRRVWPAPLEQWL